METWRVNHFQEWRYFLNLIGLFCLFNRTILKCAHQGQRTSNTCTHWHHFYATVSWERRCHVSSSWFLSTTDKILRWKMSADPRYQFCAGTGNIDACKHARTNRKHWRKRNWQTGEQRLLMMDGPLFESPYNVFEYYTRQQSPMLLNYIIEILKLKRREKWENTRVSHL